MQNINSNNTNSTEVPSAELIKFVAETLQLDLIETPAQQETIEEKTKRITCLYHSKFPSWYLLAISPIPSNLSIDT